MTDQTKPGGVQPEGGVGDRLAARKLVADHYGYSDETEVSEYCAEVNFVLRGMELARTALQLTKTGEV